LLSDRLNRLYQKFKMVVFQRHNDGY
jgi:hypothetical protein